MPDSSEEHTPIPPSLEVVPTIYPTSPPIDEVVASFWDVGPEFDSVRIRIEPPRTPLAILEQLGPSPFEQGGFPLIGFLATTYDKVSRYALDRKIADDDATPDPADAERQDVRS